MSVYNLWPTLYVLFSLFCFVEGGGGGGDCGLLVSPESDMPIVIHHSGDVQEPLRLGARCGTYQSRWTE